MVVTMLTTLRTLTTVTIATVATIRTTVTALSTLRALTALTTFTGRALHDVTLGLLNQHTVAEFVLTRLRVNLQQLHLDLVALLDAGFLNGLEALPVDLRDVQQTILTRHDLHEAAVRHD